MAEEVTLALRPPEADGLDELLKPYPRLRLSAIGWPLKTYSIAGPAEDIEAIRPALAEWEGKFVERTAW